MAETPEKSPKALSTLPLHALRYQINTKEVSDVSGAIEVLVHKAVDAEGVNRHVRKNAVGILTELGVNYPGHAQQVADALLTLSENTRAMPMVRTNALTGIGVLAGRGLQLDESAILGRIETMAKGEPQSPWIFQKRGYIGEQFTSARTTAPTPAEEPGVLRSRGFPGPRTRRPTGV